MMKRAVVLIAGVAFAAAVAANETAPRSDIEARLDALEVLNVTAYKAPDATAAKPDPQIDAILQAAAQAEAEHPQ
jgi:hypothetical protein